MPKINGKDMDMQKALLLIIAFFLACSSQQKRDYPITPVAFTQVKITGSFWKQRMETNRQVTIPMAFKKCEETGRIANFEIAGGLKEGEFQSGRHYDDSDVYKIIEGASYSLATFPDEKLDAYLDDLIAKIAAAQEEDGYLMTWRTINPNKPPAKSAGGPERWSNIRHGHELYNVGHMYEAAVAHYQATGKRTLLDVAIKNADLICRTFGPEGITIPPGHQEIEIGLVKLYRVTGNKKYLDLARFFIDQRGNAQGHELLGPYHQDHKPITEQDEAVGHAVRAGYFYSGVADVAALTGEQKYIDAIERIWENVVSKKLYITGGIGARHQGEAFGDNYELPNASAYNETCAAIANILWNQRMFLLKGEAKYIDVLERTLYNGMLSGVSLQGDTFFYPNCLECDGVTLFNHGSLERQPWFSTSCCPSNVSRFIPSVPGYFYALRRDTVYVNLYASNEVELQVNGKHLRIRQETGYPWEGGVSLTVEPEKAHRFALKLRIPGWALNRPVPSNLYKFADEDTQTVSLSVNGQAVQAEIESGYITLNRKWQRGDQVKLLLPMPVRKVVANEKVEDDRGKVAIQRGPIVFAAEAVDNFGKVLNLAVRTDRPFTAAFQENLLNGVTVVSGTALRTDKAGPEQEMRLIPYYAWNHRGAGEMAVWLKAF